MNPRAQVISCIIGIAFQLGCTRNDQFTPRFVMAQVTLPGGGILYFKRQVRGLSYDELAISTDGNECNPADPNADFIFDGLGAGAFPVFYSTSTNTLTVYDTMSLKEPKRKMEGVQVASKRLSERKYEEWQKSSAPAGISKITLDIKANSRCH